MSKSPTAAPSASFLDTIGQMRHALPPRERRLGEFLLEFPGDLASYTASELAALVGVSNATVTRFIRRLGYDSYEAARRHARQRQGEGSPLFLHSAQPVAGEGSMGAHLRMAERNMAATLEQLSQDTLDAIATAITQARSVWFLGYRNNRHFAAYLRWQLAQILPCTQVIPGSGETLGEYAMDMGPQDVLVVFALRRSLSIAAQFANRARQAGVQVVYITDQTSRVNVKAQWVLRCHCASAGPLDNHVALMLLCDLLSARVMDQAGSAGRKRLAEVEAAHEALAELR